MITNREISTQMAREGIPFHDERNVYGYYQIGNTFWKLEYFWCGWSSWGSVQVKWLGY